MNCGPCIQEVLAFFPSFHTFSPLTVQKLSPSTPYTCFVIYQSTHTNRTQQQQQKANSYSHKISFLHLILPPISLPSYNCLLFALIPLLMPWLQKAIQSGKHEVLHFHSIFHLLLNVVTSTSTPDCIHYPIYPWSDGRYYVRDTLQNKRYHPALITWFFLKKTQC